jgi:hypothetical protein
MNATEEIESKYDEVFDEEMYGLERRRLHDKNLTVESLEGTLQALYNVEGNNWEGRSSIQDQVISAQIAAYETFIANWKKEQK